MIRPWARLLALAAGVAAASPALAATINVTTFQDITRNDDLCSVREAVAASARSLTERIHRNNDRRLEREVENIVGTINRFEPTDVDPDPVTDYPREDIVHLVTIMKQEADTLPEMPAALRNAITNLHDEVQADTQNPVLSQLRRALDLIIDQGQGSKADLRSEIADEIDRLDALDEVDGCIDGSVGNRILLKRGVYSIDSGAIQIDHYVKVYGVGRKSILDGGGTNRLFNVVIDDGRKGSLLLEGVTLRGGTANGGGAVRNENILRMANVFFEGNSSDTGGAIFNTGSLQMEGGAFLGNQASGNGGAIHSEAKRISLQDVQFGSLGKGNVAGGDGGSLYLVNTPNEDFGADLKRVSFIGNAAVNGAGIAISGTGFSLKLVNATFSDNIASGAGALHVPDAVALALNNLTVVNNQALGGTAGISAPLAQAVSMHNSVLMFNANAGLVDCDFSAVAPVADPSPPLPAPAVPWDEYPGFHNNFFDVGTSCPGELEINDAEFGTNFERTVEVFADFFRAYDGGIAGYVPEWPASPLVNRGSALESNRCEDDDQRGKPRISAIDSDCDIGALEFQIARRADDTVSILMDETVCVDVVSNDVGDTEYVPDTLSIIIPPERSGAQARVVDRDDCPNRGDIDHPQAILYTPAPGFHGEDRFSYSLRALSSGASTISGEARVLTEPESGISSSSLDLGNAGSGLLLLAALCGLRRRVVRPVAVLGALLVGTVPVQAEDNIIYVDSAQDRLIPVAGDGRCTLREALLTARNDQVNQTQGDCLDGIEGPDIIELRLPAASGNRIRLEGTLQAFGSELIRCAAKQCVIAGDGSFRLLATDGSLTVEKLFFRDGNAGSGDGGAINAGGTLTVLSSRFQDNVARAGGAIFLRGGRSGLRIEDTTFVNNTSTGNDGINGGGAVATTAGDSHDIQVYGSTFAGNVSASLAAALELNTVRKVRIANSTFSGNVSTAGAGAIDVSGAAGSASINNNTVVENTSGPGFSALYSATNNIIVSNNILAANLPVDADCGSTGAINWTVEYNLFGDDGAGGNGSCPGPDAINAEADAATVLGSLTPLQRNGGRTETRAPVGAGETLIVNSGNDFKELDSETAGTTACADVDQRDRPRTAGGRCDRGAVEFQELTPADDEADNLRRLDRSVVIDILANDVSDEISGLDIKTDCAPADVLDDCILLDVSGSSALPGHFDVLPANHREVRGYILETDSPWVLRYRNPLGDLHSEDVPLIVSYRIRDVNDVLSTGSGNITVTVANVPPFTQPDEVWVNPGESVVIDVLANDRDTDRSQTPGGGGLDPASVTVVKEPQFGDYRVDPLTGSITWTPSNTFNPFTDTFTYKVSDLDPAEAKESTETTVTIRMRTTDESGGSLLAEEDLSEKLGLDFLGNLGGFPLFMLGLAALRRRR
jgi:CSLREA domain-containing protein